jgi:O-antigen ligase
MVFFTKEHLTIEKLLNIVFASFLVFLPWHTIWIYREVFVGGVKWEYTTLGFYATELLLWVVVGLFMVWYFKKIKNHKSEIINQNWKKKFTKDRLFIVSCLLFVIYAYASTFWSADKDLASQQALRIMEVVALFFVIFLGPFTIDKIAKWFVVGSVIPSILGIWQFLSQSTFASKWLGLTYHPVWQAGTSIIEGDAIGRWLRAYGPFEHPNVFGGYLVIAIGFVLFLVYRKLVIKKTDEMNEHGSRVRNQRELILLSTFYFLLLTALFFSFSRSAWIAGIVVVLLYCYIVITYHISHITYHIPFATLLIVLLTSIYFPIVNTRISGSSSHEVQSVVERMGSYHEALQLFRQRPVFGVGAGNYTVALRELNTSRPIWEIQPVHNVAALFVVEFGLIGCLLLVGILLSFITYHISHITYQKSLPFFCYVLCAMCYLFLALFDHYLLSSYTGLMLSAVFFGSLARLSPVHPLSVPKM